MFLKSLFLLITFCSSSYPQFLIEELYRVTTSENKISEVLDISNTGQLIIRETENDSQNYYLVNLINNLPLKLIFTSSQVQGHSAWFSENSRFIIFGLKDSARFLVKIYDTNNGSERELRDQYGDVARASLVDNNRILFDIRRPREYPKIYMYVEGTETPNYITEGIGAFWSPDGKWFLALKGEYVKDTSSSKRAKAFGYKIVKKPIYSIFNYLGQKILDIEKQDVHYIKWSPKSDKIVLEQNQEVHLLCLKTANNKLTIENEYYFERTSKEGEHVAFAGNPILSPETNWISYIRNVEDGHTIFESSIFAYNIDTHQQHKIVGYDDKYIQKIIWLSNNQLMFLATSIDNTEHFVYKIDIEKLVK